MRKWFLLAVLAASFALWGNGAIACASADHPTAPQTVAAEFYFDQAAPSQDHAAHHSHRKHDERTPCDGTCCCHAASAGAAMLASAELEFPAVQSVTLRRYLSDFHPRQLVTDFYGPPKSFA